jgi:hypothetical protein
MGTVVRQEKIGDSSITLSFENYRDFLDYQKKEREQDGLVAVEEADLPNDFVVNFFKTPNEVPSSKYQLVLSEEEYYYLSCILGHLVPAGDISKSLLDKVSTYDLESEDFDKIQFVGDVLGGYSIKLAEEK